MDAKNGPIAGLRNYGSPSESPTWKSRLLFIVVLGALSAGGVLLASVVHHVHHGDIGLCNAFPPSPVTAGHKWVCTAKNLWQLVPLHP